MASSELIKKLRDMTSAGVMDCKKALDENHDDLDLAVNWLREKGIAKAAKKQSAVATEGIAFVVVEANCAVIGEVNAQTDFVSSNKAFIDLVDEIANAILKNKPKNLVSAKAIKLSNGLSIDQNCIDLTAKIGEKIELRRFQIIEKKDTQTFAIYQHANKKIATVIVLESNVNQEVAKNVAMHAAAMNPKFLNKDQVDSSWLANERKVLLEQTIQEGKPKDKAELIVNGRVNKLLAESCLVNQPYVKEPSKTIEQYLKEHQSVATFYIRYEVGEGIEKKVTDFAAEVAEQMK